MATPNLALRLLSASAGLLIAAGAHASPSPTPEYLTVITCTGTPILPDRLGCAEQDPSALQLRSEDAGGPAIFGYAGGTLTLMGDGRQDTIDPDIFIDYGVWDGPYGHSDAPWVISVDTMEDNFAGLGLSMDGCDLGSRGPCQLTGYWTPRPEGGPVSEPGTLALLLLAVAGVIGLKARATGSV